MAKVNVEVKTQGKAMEDMGKILRATLMDDYYCSVLSIIISIWFDILWAKLRV